MKAPPQNPTVLETPVDVEDFIAGTNLLSGAGGPPGEALEHLLETLAEGHPLGWQSVDMLDDDALVVAAYYTGSVGPKVWRERARREAELGLHRHHKRPLIRAIQHLEIRMGREADAIIPIEIGASNTAAALDAASRLSRIVVDGDYAGRAIPSFECITPTIHGDVRPPLVLADYYGDLIEITDAANLSRMEAIGKMVATATLGRIGSAGLAFSGAEVKRLVVRDTLTESLAAGRALRRAQAAGGDVVGQVIKALRGARYLFRGALLRTEHGPDSGYTVGYHFFEGSGDWSGRELKIFFQNENHVAWLDGEPLAMSPDVIEVVDAATAEPQVNTYLEPGQEVAVLGIPRRGGLGTPEGIAAMGPARWGFDIPFLSLEASDNGVQR